MALPNAVTTAILEEMLVKLEPMRKKLEPKSDSSLSPEDLAALRQLLDLTGSLLWFEVNRISALERHPLRGMLARALIPEVGGVPLLPDALIQDALRSRAPVATSSSPISR